MYFKWLWLNITWRLVTNPAVITFYGDFVDDKGNLNVEGTDYILGALDPNPSPHQFYKAGAVGRAKSGPSVFLVSEESAWTNGLNIFSILSINGTFAS